jgi:hypothetical protein
MVLRVLPTNPEWRMWRNGIQDCDYDMGLCQFPSLAQRATAEGGGGPIVGARQISLRFALRFGQERCEHTPLEGMEDNWSGPGKVAHIMVLGDIHPRSHSKSRSVPTKNESCEPRNDQLLCEWRKSVRSRVGGRTLSIFPVKGLVRFLKSLFMKS